MDPRLRGDDEKIISATFHERIKENETKEHTRVLLIPARIADAGRGPMGKKKT